MRETKREKTYRFYQSLERLGIDVETADKLRRIEMTLSRWSELECGDGNEWGSWAIERDESSYHCTQCGHNAYGEHTKTSSCEKCGDIAPVRRIVQDGKPYMVHHHYQHGQGKDYTTRHAIADREKGALKRLAAIMVNYPDLVAYNQTDPRGCSLWLVRKSDLNGHSIESVYTRGVAVCID